MYTIKEFAKLINVHPMTLRNWDANGKLKPIRLDSGHRRYTDDHLNQIKNIKNLPKLNVIYCRESTKMQLNSLQDQINRSKAFCTARGLTVDLVISDIGSALNYKRKGLEELLDLIVQGKLKTLVIHHRDRLVRFGFVLFETLARLKDFQIIVIDDSETHKSRETEFAEDLIAIVHHFSMKLYGSRSYKRKIKPVEKAIEETFKE